MTAKEKAKELYEKFYYGLPKSSDAWLHTNSKQCAIIAVDEIILVADAFNELEKEYWEKVKDEINKL